MRPRTLFTPQSFHCLHTVGKSARKRTIFRDRLSERLTFPTMNKPWCHTAIHSAPMPLTRTMS